MSLRKKDLYYIKPMTVSDLDHIYELELECYEFPWSKNILRDCILYKYDSFSVFYNHILVGYVIAKINMEETHILNLTVSPKHRRYGVGSSLLDSVLDDAKIRESKHVILEVRESNENARILYAKYNFSVIGRRKDYYESATGREDALVLSLEL